MLPILSNKKIIPLIITSANIASRLIHFIFLAVAGNKYGTSAITGSVITLLSPFIVLSSVASSVLDAVVMPMFHRAEKENIAGYIYNNDQELSANKLSFNWEEYFVTYIIK